MPGGDQRSHVKRRSNGRAASPRCPNATILSAVSVDGCDANERSDLLSGTLSQLRKFGQETKRSLRSHARDASEQVFFITPCWRLLDRILQLLVQLFQLLTQGFADCFNCLANELVGGLLKTVFFLRYTYQQFGVFARVAASVQAVFRWATSAFRGRTATPNCARISASIASVLASLPVARAKSRTWRGFTTTTGNPAAANSATTARS